MKKMIGAWRILPFASALLIACGSGGGDTPTPDVMPDVGHPDDITVGDGAPRALDVTEAAAPDHAMDLAWLEVPEVSDSMPDIEAAEFGAETTDTADLSEEVEVVEPLQVVLPVESLKSQWGGYLDLPVNEGTGFFATAIHDGRAWLVDPQGYAFFSLGVQAVGAGSLQAPALGYAPGTLAQHAAWADKLDGWGEIAQAINEEHLQTMLNTGFNSVGGWSGGVWKQASGKIAYSHSLGFAGSVQDGSTPIPAVSTGGFPDVFHPEFDSMCLEYAAKSISAELAADPWNLGYYSDNEQRWWGKDYFIESTTWTLADDFIDEAAGTPAKTAFVAYMEERYQSDLAAFNEVYGTQLESFAELADLAALPLDVGNETHHADRMGFVELIADAYFAGVRSALKEVAPNHLYLCVRFGSVAPDPVVRKAGQYCDVVSINDYYIVSDPITDFALGGTPEERWESHGKLIFDGGGPKPVLITEWGLRADDSGLPNTFGAGYVEETQQDRAEFYEWSARWFLERQHEGTGYIAGWHWFMYMDEPATGRFDGEDSNYGLVSIRDEKYAWLLQGMEAVNGALDTLFAHGIEATLLLPPDEVTLEMTEAGVTVDWVPVEGAQSYRVSALHHPAGLENRIVEQLEADAPPVVLALDNLGRSQVWVGVETIHSEALHLGIRVAGPVEFIPMPVDGDSTGEVLACEVPAAIICHNDFPLPNDAAGQTYATSVESFADAGGSAFRLEFVPSSLGYVVLAPSPTTELTVELQLPVNLDIPVGGALTFELLPMHLVKSGSEVVPASEFVTVRLLDSGEQIVHAATLQEMAGEAGVPVTVNIPIDFDIEFRTVQFVVDLFSPGLPMEQPVRILVDNITIQPVS
jgi:hypothetical protein